MWKQIPLVFALVAICCVVAAPTESATEIVEDVMETTTFRGDILSDDTEVVEVATGTSSSSEESTADTTNPSKSESDDAKEFDPNDCFLEKAVGPCRAAIDSWFFNVATHSCESFLWSGCGGNANRFDEEEDCEKRCMNRNLTSPALVKNETLAKSEDIEDTEAAASDDVSMTTIIVQQEAVTEASSTSSSTSSSSSSSSSSTTTTSGTTTTPAPSSTSSTSAVPIIKSKKVDCPKFNGCPPKCIVVQEQSNHGCKTCQCPASSEKNTQAASASSANSNANSETRVSSTSSSSSSVKVTRSASPAEAPVYIKSAPAVGSVSGLPVKIDEEEPAAVTEIPEDVCNLPPTRGHCRAMMTRYRYDAKKKDCVEFHFGGCEGNANNFVSKEKCQEFCKGQ